MTVEFGFEIGFAAAVIVVAVSLAAAALERAPRAVLWVLTGLLGAGAAAGWVAFTLRPGRELGVSAAGITACVAAEAAAVALARAIARSRRIEDEVARAEQRLNEVVERESATRAAELERVLARARAESVSLLAEEERRIAEERRAFVAERERAAVDDLGQALAVAQKRVEQRVSDWVADLDRTQQTLGTQLARFGERQRQLIAEAEARLTADVARLESEGEEQRLALHRLREEVERATAEAIARANEELETHAAERRRALHELNERLRSRERSLGERVEREEVEASQRLHASFADVERRQVEQLERVVGRAASGYSDTAAQQFADAIKGAREEAARRLSRELDRAVQQFAHEAESVLAERLAHVGDAGAQRLEKRMSQVAAGFERQRDELVGGLERRLTEAEDEIRRRVEAIAADAEAERGVLEARLHELSRRVEEAATTARDRLAAAER